MGNDTCVHAVIIQPCQLFTSPFKQNIMTTLDNPTNVPDPANVPMRPTAMKYGLIGGLILIVLSLVYNMADMIDYTGQESNWLSNVLNWGVMIGVIVMAIKQHRDEELGGYIKFGRCIGLGTLIGLVIGVLTGIFGLIYFNLIDPGLIDEIMSQFEENFSQQGMDENAMEMALSWTRSMFSPVGLFLMSLVMSVVSTLVS